MNAHPLPNRRSIITGGIAAATGLVSGGLLSFGARAAGKAPANLQLGWIPGVNQVGEVVAKRLGFYQQEGLDFAIQPGGPNIDGVAIVASGRYEVGQVASSPSIMLAASQGLPIKCFAVAGQKHPFAFFSLPKAPVRKPADFVGKRVGIQSTSAVILRALLAKHKVPEKDVKVITIGPDLSPLLTGQVDVVTGWLTSTTAIRALGPDRIDLPLWDAGIPLYALPYYATTKTLETNPQAVAAFLRATARGWQHTAANRDQAADLLVQEYPNLKRDDERVAIDAMLAHVLTSATQKDGFGAMDEGVWQEQVSTYAALGQFTAKTPKVSDFVTFDFLKSTAAARTRA